MCTLVFWATLRSLVNSLSSFSSFISNWPLCTSYHSNSRKTSPCTSRPHCHDVTQVPIFSLPDYAWQNLPNGSPCLSPQPHPTHPSLPCLKFLNGFPWLTFLHNIPLLQDAHSHLPPSLKYRMILLPRITPLPFSPYSHATDQPNINSSLGLPQLLHSVSSIFLSLVMVQNIMLFLHCSVALFTCIFPNKPRTSQIRALCLIQYWILRNNPLSITQDVLSSNSFKNKKAGRCHCEALGSQDKMKRPNYVQQVH